MKISIKWLNDYVDVKDFFSKPEELGDLLTRAGLEVEEIVNRAKDFQNVVIGHILEKDKHPNADKLSLCRVSTGDVVHQIVCGAQNHKAGDKVIVALPGAVLPGNFAIKKSAVRGVDSAGMLCSLKELGLAKESEGLFILPADAPLGMSYAEFGGYDDVVFELKVTPNRADCLSHFGLARETACLLGRELKTPNYEVKASGESSKSMIGVDVKTPGLCPRYTGRFIKGVKVKESPAWLQKKLEAVGLNPINNIVDITNFVMMELGQPLHAFDASLIKGKKIIVDKAPVGEKFITLDGTEKTLKGEELTIRDSERGICLAGVVGGRNSGVSDSTTDIFLEAAYFVPMSVRKTSRSLGLDSDSAYRFSRGVDPDGAMRASNRAANLIAEIAGGVIFGEAHDLYPQPVVKKEILISISTVSERLGYEAEELKFVDYMKRLGCQVVKKGTHYSVLPPTYRFDIDQDMDLVEEYARLHGYEHIPDVLPASHQEPKFHDKEFMLDMKLSRFIRAEGFSQAFNFAFVGSAQEAKFLGDENALKASGLHVSSEKIRILNPLNEEMDVMRSSLSFGLYRNLVNNINSGNSFGKLYEMGKSFYKEEAYLESRRLGLIQWGRDSHLWNSSLDYPIVFEVKATIELILSKLNIGSYTWVKAEKKDVPSFMHLGQFAVLVVEGKKLGFVGSLHPSLIDEEKIRVPIALAEIDLDALYKGQPRTYRIQRVSKFQAVKRDLALKIRQDISVGDVLKDIRKSAGSLLSSVEVFDVYIGDKVEVGFKSVAIRMILQDKAATLLDVQINEAQNKVLESLKKNFDISIR